MVGGLRLYFAYTSIHVYVHTIPTTSRVAVGQYGRRFIFAGLLGDKVDVPSTSSYRQVSLSIALFVFVGFRLRSFT